MTFCLTEITWGAVAAIATLAAVVVALLPIWRDARRRRGAARGLRLRLCSNLTFLRPSLGKIVRHGHASYPTANLSKEEFRDAVRSVAAMLPEAVVLEPDEQDQLGITFTNLQMASSLYETSELTADSAKHILELIDRSISIMEKHGLLHSPVKTPWENDREANGA